MPLLVTSVPNLVQGISQQPDNLRYPGQSDEQVNAWSTIVEGLVKRPNTEFVDVIDPVDDTDLFTHFVKRDEDNKYVVTVGDNRGPEVKVTNLETGNDIPVSTTPIATSYLSGITTPRTDLTALTVADYTFLVNKNKQVLRNTDADLKSKDVRNDEGKYEALVFVKLGDYEKAYSIYLDGKLIPPDTALDNHHEYVHVIDAQPSTYISGPSSGTHAGKHADTEFIARDLAQCLDTYFSAGVPGIASAGLTGGSGFEDSGRVGVPFPLTEVAYEFFLEQDDLSGNLIGTGAKGTVVFKNGSVQSSELTHKGSGYDSAIYATDNTTLRLIIRKYDHLWSWNRIAATITTDITTNLPTAAVTFTPTGSNITIEREGAVIKLTSDDDFSIRTEDGLANQGLGVAYKEVNSIVDLPSRCFNRFRVKVRGDADTDQDDYYVEFQTKDKEDYGEGSWVEIAGWTEDVRSAKLIEGIDTTLDVTTMPITLVPELDTNGNVSKFFAQSPQELSGVVKVGSTVYNVVEDHESNSDNQPGGTTDTNGDGIFDWEEYWVVTTQYTDAPAWIDGVKYTTTIPGYASRTAGDDYTNPFPSFTEKTINDVFFFKNRLGFLTDSNVIFSEADQYFNFFRTTTQQLLDSAPIDVGLSHTKVAILEHALPFQEKLMLFGRQSQFVLRGADVLSPKTVSISPVTEFDITDKIDPIALGNYIYFPFKRNAFEGMYEYFIDNNTEVFDATEITAQVPKLIPADVTHLVGSASENMIVCKSSEDDRTLYVYKYYWQNREKIQSAWMKFTYSSNIRGFDFIDSELYLIMGDGTNLHLEKAIMENGVTDDGLDYKLLLDKRLDSSSLTATYDAASKTTTISGFPYDPTDVVVYTKGGTLVEFTRDTDPAVFAGTVSGDLSSTPFFAGVSYNMLYRFSNQILKQPTERGGRSASDYTFQTIRNASIEYADTGHFTVEVTPRFRSTYSYPYNPALLASLSTLDSFTPESGHFRFPVQAQPNEATIEIKSDSALPCKLLAAEFESMIIPRAKRYGS